MSEESGLEKLKKDFILRFSGSEDLGEALAAWQAERSDMLILHDQNTALKINDRRMRLVIQMCARVFELLDGSMFLPPKVGDMIVKVRGQIDEVENLVADRSLLEEKIPP